MALIALAATGCGESANDPLTSASDVEARFNGAATVHVCCVSTLYTGNATQLQASAYDYNGNRILDPAVIWSSGSLSVATVSGSTEWATVNAVGAGQTPIYATVNGITASTTITVLASPVVNNIQIVGAPVSVQMGYPELVTARAYDQNGNQLNNAQFSWSVQNTAVATVSSSGTVTPVATGTTTLTVSAGGVSASAQLTVTPFLDAAISGPGTVWTAGVQQWSVQPTGGNGTYTYEWWVDYVWGAQSQMISTSSSASLHVDENTGPFLIRATVRSAGSTVEPGIMVCNFIAGANC